MFFQMVYKTSGLHRMHSPDLTDMRRAILEEDDDGPDGGCIRFPLTNRISPALSQRDMRRPR